MPMMATIRIATMTIHIRFLPPGARGAGVTGSAKVPPPSEPDAIRGARLRRKNSKTLFNRFRRVRKVIEPRLSDPLFGQSSDHRLHSRGCEVAFVAEELSDPFRVEATRDKFLGRCGWWGQKERSDSFEILRKFQSDVRRRSIEGAPFTKPLHGARGPDSLDAFVEVGAEQDGDVDQLLPCQPKMREILLEIEDLGRNGARTALARQEFGRTNRQEADYARGAEEQRIVIFRSRGPYCTLTREERGLRRRLAGRLDPRHPEPSEEDLGFLDHGPREPRGHDGLGERGRGVSSGRGLLVLPLRLLAGFAPLADLFPFELRRRSVEDEDRVNVELAHETRRSEDQPVEMRRDPTMGVLQRRAVSGPHDREELVQLQVTVDRDRSAAQRFQGGRVADGNRRQLDSHDLATVRGLR